MSKFSLETLAEGIRSRHMGEENSRLVEKWSRTGLLRGLESTKRENMARLLENQTAELLREQSTIGTGGGAGTGIDPRIAPRTYSQSSETQAWKFDFV